MGGITINEREWSYEWSGERSRERSRERSGEWSCETLLDFLQCRSWSFTIFEYNINISTLVYVSFNGICYNNRVGWNGVRSIAIYDDSFVRLFILRH